MIFCREQSTRSLGSYRGRNAVGIRRKRTSYRLHCPGVFSRAKKGHGKLSRHFTADYPAIETVFRIIISANQLSRQGAVVNMCANFETHQDGSGEPDVLMCQSIVLGEIKAENPPQNGNPSNHQILWQQYMERIESLSPESKVSRLCMEAGFMRIVEVGTVFHVQGHW